MEAEASGKMEELLLEVNNEAEAALDWAIYYRRIKKMKIVYVYEKKSNILYKYYY
jgi:hypothetical protein